MKVVGTNGEVKWDGTEMGELCLRAPWIAESYYNDDRTVEGFRDGWLYTGDVVTVDEEGCVKIVDRTKDVIKRGEWISSVDLENALMAHDAIFEAAVVAVPHPQWQERPIACVVQKKNSTVTKKKYMSFKTTVCEVVVARRYCLYGRNTENICWEVFKTGASERTGAFA